MGLFNSIKCGWHEGKGHKYSRKNDYENALKHYISALESSDNEGGKPVLLEYITNSLISLGRYNESLSYAEKSYSLYKKQEDTSPIFKDGTKRMERILRQLTDGTGSE